MQAPDFKAGDNPKVVAAKALAALAEANQRLDNDFLWYDDIRRGYAAP